MIKKWVIAGLLVWIPLVVTVWVMQLLIGFLDHSLMFVPAPWRPEQWFGFEIPGIGIVLSLVLILATGFLAANFIGKRVVRAGEGLLSRIPLVRTIYSSVKRLTETVLDEDSTSFRKVLLVQWPREGLWTLAFQTGDPVAVVEAETGREMLTIFVPTTPNPTSGFIMFSPREDVTELDMAVEDAVRMIISLGAVTPDKAATLAQQEAAQLAADNGESSG